jgi:hypothetical protein
VPSRPWHEPTTCPAAATQAAAGAISTSHGRLWTYKTQPSYTDTMAPELITRETMPGRCRQATTVRRTTTACEAFSG